MTCKVRGKPQGSAYTWNTPFFDLQFVNIRTKKGKNHSPKKRVFSASHMGKLGIVFSSQLQWTMTKNFRLSMLPSSSRIEAGEALALGATVTLWSHLRATLATRHTTRAQNKAGAEFQKQGDTIPLFMINWIEFNSFMSIPDCLIVLFYIIVFRPHFD